ncbi:MAG: beta-galactosidase, partial [Sedimentisphaerales bacterium]|nr:beta-galactosidase [Sedimentisphaerales bacterium]
MMMQAKINTWAITMGIVGVILTGAVAEIGASDTKQQPAPSAVHRLKQEHPAGCYLIWGKRDLVRTCDFLKGGQIMVQWHDIAPARGKFNWSKLDEGLRFFAKIGRPTTVQVNANTKPDWLWDYVANCG